MAVLLLCLVAIPLLLLLTELLAQPRDRRRYPPPGQIANGLHAVAKGTASPAVILESGLASSSLSWVHIQARAAAFARVVAYDRAGLGWSPSRNSPLTLEHLLSDLQLIVQSQKTPVILVGHSFGGLLISAFSHLYPNQVGGLLLIDPVSLVTYAIPDQPHRARLQRAVRLAKRGAVLARFAIVRIALSLVARGSRKLPALIGRVSAGNGTSVMNRLATEVAKLPPETYGPIRSHWSRVASFHLLADYLRLLPELAAQAQTLPIPAHIPVIILSAATATPAELAERDAWASAHPFSRHTQIPNTAHWLQLDRPDLVTEAIRELTLLIE